jgi:hypothetical protein
MIPAPVVPDRLDVDARVQVLPRAWFLTSCLAAGLATMGSVIGLFASEQFYGQETADLHVASTAQDLVNLFVASPLVLVLSWAARRGSVVAWRCLIGVLAFTAYNYAIYCFSIHFGPLFLTWVAVLGLAVFAFAGALWSLAASPRVSWGGRYRFPAWFLMAAAGLFAALWLSVIVPDLLAGRGSTAAATWALPTSPVHVLDLAILLPAAFVAGLLLLRRRDIGAIAAPGALIFLGATALPPMVIPFLLAADQQEPGWILLVPMSIVILGVAVSLRLLLSGTATPRPQPAEDA